MLVSLVQGQAEILKHPNLATHITDEFAELLVKISSYIFVDGTIIYISFLIFVPQNRNDDLVLSGANLGIG
ncbi:MAG: hypothetical protein N4A49_03080 [Marinifilaceae bacterium]|jgi:hypothetical protein|nr:hypothetical protein [Marinifilaceae bacterium]